MRLPATVLLLLSLGTPSLATGQDGTYGANFNYKMTPQSLCSSPLSISLRLKVKNNIVSGFIKNNGSSNTNSFCNTYHDGTISGRLDNNGSLVNTSIKQKDTHSAQYSSYKITGNIENNITIVSRSAKFHPNVTIKLSKYTSSQATRQIQKPNQNDVVRNVFRSYSVDNRLKIQRILKNRGYYNSSIDGLYGTNTRNAIIRYVKDSGYSALSFDGISKAIEVLNSDNNEKKQQIVIADTINITKQDKSIVADSKPTGSSLANSIDRREYQLEMIQTPNDAQQIIDEIQATLVMYLAIQESIVAKPETVAERVSGVVDREISRLESEKNSLQEKLSRKFTTPIRPTNVNLQTSAFRASDTFPKVPFYVPGTNEIGETLVIPKVTPEGYLNYEFSFIDPTASFEKVRDSVNIPHDQIEILISGIDKIDEWTTIAQENGVNRRLSKTAACIPKSACAVKKTGVSSTEVLFQTYEDGSTSGRIQINKGRFNVGYNMSVESTILLQAYLIYMRDEGAREFNIGVMSDDELLNLFE